MTEWFRPWLQFLALYKVSIIATIDLAEFVASHL